MRRSPPSRRAASCSRSTTSGSAPGRRSPRSSDRPARGPHVSGPGGSGGPTGWTGPERWPVSEPASGPAAAQGGRSTSFARHRGRGRSAGVLIATASTLIVLAVITLAIVNAPGFSRVQATFFDADVFADSFPAILRAFALNVRLFLTAEFFILICA